MRCISTPSWRRRNGEASHYALFGRLITADVPTSHFCPWPCPRTTRFRPVCTIVRVAGGSGMVQKNLRRVRNYDCRTRCQCPPWFTASLATLTHIAHAYGLSRSVGLCLSRVPPLRSAARTECAVQLLPIAMDGYAEMTSTGLLPTSPHPICDARLN